MNEALFEQMEDMGAEVEDTVDRLMGDRELYVQYLLKLPEDPNMPALVRAVEQKDKDGALRAVHTLKGVALNLGLLPLVDVCMDMLLDFRAGNEDKAYAQLEGVKSTFDEWVTLVQNAAEHN